MAAVTSSRSSRRRTRNTKRPTFATLLSDWSRDRPFYFGTKHRNTRLSCATAPAPCRSRAPHRALARDRVRVAARSSLGRRAREKVINDVECVSVYASWCSIQGQSTIPDHTTQALTIPHHNAQRTTHHHTIPYHTIPYHTIHHTIPYYTIPYRIIPYHTIHHTIPYHIIPYHTTPYHTTLHYTPHHAPPSSPARGISPTNMSRFCNSWRRQ